MVLSQSTAVNATGTTTATDIAMYGHNVQQPYQSSPEWRHLHCLCFFLHLRDTTMKHYNIFWHLWRSVHAALKQTPLLCLVLHHCKHYSLWKSHQPTLQNKVMSWNKSFIACCTIYLTYQTFDLSVLNLMMWCEMMNVLLSVMFTNALSLYAKTMLWQMMINVASSSWWYIIIRDQETQRNLLMELTYQCLDRGAGIDVLNGSWIMTNEDMVNDKK